MYIFYFIANEINIQYSISIYKLPSRGGKEVLINSVAQALPTYVMSCFLLPQEIIRKLTSVISRFWWSTKNNNRGLHWVAWKKICAPKEGGGLGSEILKTSISHYL